LPKDLLDRVKIIAKQKGKTVSAILNELLRDFADGESEIEAIKKRLDVLEKEVEELKTEKKP
jgi:polyhydroxyalkanoate synthesis regulator phasin